MTAAVLAAVPLALILKQPDLSTSIVIVFFILCLIYMAGISYKWIAGALAVAVPSLALVVWLAEHNMMPFLEALPDKPDPGLYQSRKICGAEPPAG